jgi:hypothetical protein
MRSPRILDDWRPTLSRADLLCGCGAPAAGLVRRAVVSASIVLAPLFAVALVCTAFVVVGRLV